MSTSDAIIIGGGPAGAAAAISLARSGGKVALVERTTYGNVRIGETLPPEIKVVLHRLDAWAEFLAGSPVLSPGTVSAWGRPETYENDFIVNPYGGGWHVDRGRFDAALMSVAERCGVRVLLGEGLLATPRWERGTWTVSVGPASAPATLEARVLVDASGRNAAVATRLGARRVFYDRLVAVVRFYDSAHAHADGRTLVEAAEHGWWYSAPLPDSRKVVAYMTDADLLPRTIDDVVAQCERMLCHAPHTRARLDDAHTPSGVSIVPARTSLLVSSSTNAWLAAGDAAATCDPLSSCGVSFALHSGIRAADAILGLIAGDEESAARYSGWIARTFETYLSNRAIYYSRERRWPESPFWVRRTSIRGSEVPKLGSSEVPPLSDELPSLGT